MLVASLTVSAVLTACGGGQAPAASTSTPPVSTPTPIAILAAQYATIASKYNAQSDAGSQAWTNSSTLAQYQAVCASAAASNQEFAASISAIQFPAAIAADAKDLVKAVEVDRSDALACSKDTSMLTLYTDAQAWASAGKVSAAAANVLRLDLGLPATT